MRNRILALDAASVAARLRMSLTDTYALNSVTVRDDAGQTRHFSAFNVTLMHDGTEWIFRCNGTSSYLKTTSNVALSGFGNRLILGIRVRVNGTTGSGTHQIVQSGTALSVGRFSLYMDDGGGNLPVIIMEGNAGFSGYRNNVSISGTMRTLIADFDKSKSTAEATLTVGTASAGTQTFNANNTDAFTDQTIYVGRNEGGTTNYLNGDIARLVLCHNSDGKWTSADTELMRAWLEGTTGIEGPIVLADVDIVRTLGHGIFELAGLHGGIDKIHPSISLPNRYGELESEENFEVPPRQVRVGLVVRAKSIAERHGVLSYLLNLLTRGTFTVRTGDSPWKQLTGRLNSSASVESIGRHSLLDIPDLKLTLDIKCADPLFYDVDESTLALSATVAGTVPVGTAPHGGKLRFYNNVPSSIVVKNSAGTTMWSMTLTTGALPGGDYVEIDLDAETIVRSTTGVLSDAMSLMTAGTFGRIEHSYSSGLNNPTITASHDASYTFKRAWIL